MTRSKKKIISSSGRKSGGPQESATLIQELERIDGALSLSPKDANLYFSQGNIRSLLGNDLAALDSYENAINIDDLKAEYHFNRGILLHRTSRYDDAVESFKRVIEINSKYPKAFYNLASTQFKLSRYAEALNNFQEAAIIDENHLDAIIGKGQTLSALYDYEGAKISFEKALSLDSKNEKVFGLLASVYVGLKEFKYALDIFKKLTVRQPENHQYWCGLGASLHGLNKPSESLDALNKCLSLKHDFPDAHYNHGLIHQDAGNLTEAELHYKKALEYDETHKMAHNNLAYLYLGVFNLTKGWQEYEWRWRSPGFDSAILKTSKPRWHGEALSNRLFVWAEQGIGDQMLYGSLLKLFEIYPQKIIVSLDSRLIPAFSRTYPKLTFIDKQLPLTESEYDQHIPIGSLCEIFIQKIQDLEKRKAPFLFSNKFLTSAIVDQMSDQKKLLCGISWKSTNKNIGADKSLSLEELIPLLSNPRFKFINLQHGDTADEIKTINDVHGRNIYNIEGLNLFEDIDGLISTIDACDFVITTSNSTAHLAGSLNKKTYLLVPKTKGKLWYWHDIKGISPWYPSIKIFSQSTGGDWSDPINQIQVELEKISKK